MVAVPELCRTLNVTKLPTVHYYQNNALVEDFTCSPKKFDMVRDRLSKYIDTSEVCEEAPCEVDGPLGPQSEVAVTAASSLSPEV